MHKRHSVVCLTHGWSSQPRSLPSHSSRTERRSKTPHSVMLFLVNDEVTNSFEDNQQTFLWTDLQQSSSYKCFACILTTSAPWFTTVLREEEVILAILENSRLHIFKIGVYSLSNQDSDEWRERKKAGMKVDYCGYCARVFLNFAALLAASSCWICIRGWWGMLWLADQLSKWVQGKSRSDKIVQTTKSALHTPC